MAASKSTVRQIDNTPFPANGSKEEQLHFLLNYAALAPSHYNIQPWKFNIAGNCLSVYLAPSRVAEYVDPQGREVTISCGAAIYMVEVAAKHFGFATGVMIPDANDEHCVAKIKLMEAVEPTTQDNLLFSAIKRRQTNRRWFDDSLVPEKIQIRCNRQTQKLDTNIAFVTDLDTRTRFAMLTEIAVKQQFSQPWFRQELSGWLRGNSTHEADGMPSFGLFSTRKFTPLARTLLRLFNRGKDTGQLNRQKIIDGSPTLCVLATQEDNQAAWINTGRAMLSVLLTLATAGLSASFMNQAIQTSGLRRQVADIFGSAPYPQLVLRVGNAESVAWTPRREIKDCLV